jgi:EmrB/QacA subfamily drug resistance transporter
MSEGTSLRPAASGAPSRDSVEALFDRYGPAYRLLVTITGMTASFTMVLTGTIVNVAVPNVMGAFGVGQDLAQFMATAFIATMTASQLLNAWFVSVFGPRLTFTIVLTVFSLGGLLCIVSTNLDFIILGRVMQGFASGVIQPLVMVTIIRVFPAHRRGVATSVYAVGLTMALGLGPVVGGLTVDYLSWRFIFVVPLPLVAFALVMGSFFMPEDAPARECKPFDVTGYALLCLALFCLMWGIASGQREGWTSDTILVFLSVGAVSALLFVRSQMRADAALLDMSLITNFRFASALMVAAVFGVGNFATTYVMPVFGQLVQGLSATTSGMFLLPASLVMVMALPFTGYLCDRLRADVLILGGLGLFGVGVWLVSDADVNTTYAYIALCGVVARLGMAFITPGLMTCALAAVPEIKLPAASGTINFFRQLGGAFGINSLVAMMERRSAFHADALTATQVAGNAATREFVDGAQELLRESGHHQDLTELLALNHLSDALQAQASTLAFQDGFRMIVAVFLFAMIPAWILSRSSRVS